MFENPVFSGYAYLISNLSSFLKLIGGVLFLGEYLDGWRNENARGEEHKDLPIIKTSISMRGVWSRDPFIYPVGSHLPLIYLTSTNKDIPPRRDHRKDRPISLQPSTGYSIRERFRVKSSNFFFSGFIIFSFLGGGGGIGWGFWIFHRLRLAVICTPGQIRFEAPHEKVLKKTSHEWKGVTLAFLLSSTHAPTLNLQIISWTTKFVNFFPIKLPRIRILKQNAYR
jgi:hypothetical protein